MKITISNSILDNFVLKNKEYLVDENYYDLPSGQQEYHLYSYLSIFFNNTTILDIGTLNGRSAVSLSHNDTNQVISYNINDDIRNPKHKIYTKPNIEFRIKDVLEDLTEEFIKKIKIIVIDIDHFETIETKIIKKLDELKFSGIILLDDIHHPDPEMNACMQKLWNNLPYRKIDITRYAHWSGTGVVFMNTDIEFDLK
jgi:predicted O-methyltransferase YrrM